MSLDLNRVFFDITLVFFFVIELHNFIQVIGSSEVHQICTTRVLFEFIIRSAIYSQLFRMFK